MFKWLKKYDILAQLDQASKQDREPSRFFTPESSDGELIMSVKREPKGNERHCPKHTNIVLASDGECAECAVELEAAKDRLKGWDSVDTSTEMSNEAFLSDMQTFRRQITQGEVDWTDPKIQLRLADMVTEAKRRGMLPEELDARTGEIATGTAPEDGAGDALPDYLRKRGVPKPKKGKPPVDWTKPVRVADTNEPVEVITTKARGEMHVLVYIGNLADVYASTEDGAYVVNVPSPHLNTGMRIENVPPMMKVWINFYPTKQPSGDPFVVTMHMSETEAAKLRGPTCTLSLALDIPTEVQS